MENNIIIYRNQLFKISETFIPNQAEKLKYFKPIYVGRKIFGKPPENSKIISMDSTHLISHLKYVLFRDTSYFKRKVINFKPKLIHAHFGVEGVYALNLAKELNIPLITTFHGFDATITNKSLLLSKKPAWINYFLFKKQLAKEGDLFICVSEFIRKKVIEMGFPENKTITHYIGIDINSIQPKMIKKSKYKIILHVARLTEKKGTKYLIDAFATVYKYFKNVKLVIIGTGELEDALRKQVIKLGLNDKILFLGAQPHENVIEWMQKSDIFCLPSITANSGDTEGLGMVFLEAGLCKLPVVATDSGGIPEVVLDSKTGYLVPERDSDKLAEKLLLLLKDENIRKKMGENAKATIKERFDINKQTEKLEEIYKEILWN